MEKGLLLFGAVVVYSLIQKSKAAGNLNFYPSAVKNIQFDGVTPTLQVGLLVQNTSGTKIVLHSVAGNVTANGYTVGNVGYFLPQNILPNSQGVIWLTIRFGLIGIVQDIINSINNGTFNQKLIFAGAVNVDNYQVPLTMDYKIGA